MSRRRERELLRIGWREWLRLPALGVDLIKAKVDTGARTSALHADELELFETDEGPRVRFVIHPRQRSHEGAVVATADVQEMRRITSSNGVAQLRPVIETTIDLGGIEWPIELTLTSRDVMGFRMLLGRQAIRGHALVDPGRSFLTRKGPARKARRKQSSK